MPLPRIRLGILVITLSFLCHGFSRARAQSVIAQTGTSAAAAPSPSRQHLFLPSRKNGGPTTLSARELWTKGPVIHAIGQVELDYAGIRLYCDSLTFNNQTKKAEADGHVVLYDAREKTRIRASRAVYDFAHSQGEFDNFNGFSGALLAGQRRMLLSNNPLFFHGRRLLQLGPRRFRIDDGSITSCTLPHPKWTLTAHQTDFTLGRSATLHGAAFRFYGVPVFYFPYLTHSLRANGRQSGFLIPNIGHSTQKGNVLGDAFYWAINRSWGVTLGGEYYSTRGWAEHIRLDSRPTRESRLQVGVDGVFDRLGQGGQEVRVAASHAPVAGFRAVVDADYLSAYVLRLVFQPSLDQAINSEAISTGFLEKQENGFDYSLVGRRYQNFLSQKKNDDIIITSLPSLGWSSWDRKLVHALPLYLSWDTDWGLLDRSQPQFGTGLVDRLHLAPELTLPWHSDFGDWLASAGVDETYYSSQQNPAGAPGNLPQLIHQAINRTAERVQLRWIPPGLEKVYKGSGSWLGVRWKHVLQPSVAFHYTTGVHNFQHLLQFDPIDILTDTRELDYQLSNRFYVEDKDGSSRELLSWTLEQKYFLDPTFGGALIPGHRNVFLTTAQLTPFAFESLARPFSPISSIVRVSPWANFEGEWRLDVGPSGSIRASAFSGDFHVGSVFFDGSHFLVRAPTGLNPKLLPGGQKSFDQFRFSTGYGARNQRGLSVGLATAYDLERGVLQYGAIESSYNWDCCGISFEYRRFSLLNIKRGPEYFFSFNLANVASFGNLRTGERLF